MRRAWIARGLALLVGLTALLVGGPAAGEGAEPEKGFISLFNGKDLTGWRYKGSKENLSGKTETADGRVKVENGAIVMMPKDSKGKGGIRDLYTLENYARPFHLKLQFRAGPRPTAASTFAGRSSRCATIPLWGRTRRPNSTAAAGMISMSPSGAVS